MIRDNIVTIEQNIASICKRLNRNPQEIAIVGVTKYGDASKIKEAVEAGVKHIGENRVQDALEKFPVLDGLKVKVTKHLIGHLQANKAKYAVQLFDMIQSVDSFKLAQEIDRQASKNNRVMNILAQINTSGEAQKFGAEKSDGLALVEQAAALKNLRILGLMTIGPMTEDKSVVRQCFRDLRAIYDEISKKFSGSEKIKMQYLSMGMTDDYEIALEEGSNMVRIGRAIFK